jgi:tetratricopeptide (TPR) repeat protein
MEFNQMNDGTLLTPLSIVLAFIGVIEATLAFRVTSLQGISQMIFVWFMVIFPALVLAGFFYVQITNPLSWYPPSELNKTSVERLQFLRNSSPKLLSVEVLSADENRKSVTFGQEATLQSQALDLYEKGKYEEALKLFEQAVKTQSEITGPRSNPSDLAAAYINKGTTLTSLGNLDEAEETFQKAQVIYEKLDDQGSISIVLNNLGSVYKARGQLDKATKSYSRALAISERIYGSDHPDIATMLNNLASVYADMGDLSKAEEFFMKALAINQKVLGSDHPRTATSLNNLGTIYRYQGDFIKALEFYQQALAITEKTMGPSHPAVEAIKRNIDETKPNIQ